MKRIVMLTCPKAETVCTGASCLQAYNQRTHAFEQYKNEETELLAFMKCSGCGHTVENDAGLEEKIKRILSIKPDVVHVGICCCKKGSKHELCQEVVQMTDIFNKAGIPIVRGTHSSF